MTRNQRGRIGVLVLSAVIGIGFVAPVRGFAQSTASYDSAEIDLNAMIRVAARLYGLDPNLLAAIAVVESDDNSDAVSPKGAEGLMQLMPATAAKYGVTNPYDPAQSLLGAARFLSYLERTPGNHDGYPMNLPDLIAAYNAGAGAVAKYHGIPPYAETRRYVSRVLLNYFSDDARRTRAIGLAAPILRYPTLDDPKPTPSKQARGNALARLARIRRTRSRALATQQREHPGWPR